MAAGDAANGAAAGHPKREANRRNTTVAQSIAAHANAAIDRGIGLYQIDSATRPHPVIPIPVAAGGQKKGPVAQAAGARHASVGGGAGQSQIQQNGVGSGSWLTDWLQKCFFRRGDNYATGSDGGDGDYGSASTSVVARPTDAPAKVSIISLLSYSTTKERWLMAFGLLMAAVSGCAVPTWLILLANGLDKFSNLGFLINAGANLMDVVQEELNKLVVAFAILGGISLLSGSLYVSIWTYTGEKSALRIKEKFVKSAFHQDAEWFDMNNRDELPTKVANSMIHISGAIGRQMADLFANLWSSAGCLAVALVLNAPLALIMLLIVPAVVIFIAIISCFIRKASKQSGHSFGLAGALATEVLAGIKTVASLCAEPWAMSTYGEHVIEAQKSSVWAGFLTALSTGITSLLFYITYTFAFFIGTQQVANNSSTVQFLVCLIGPWIADLNIQLPPWWGIIGGGIIGGIGGGGGDESVRFLQSSNATNSTNSTEIGIGDIIDGIEAISELYDPELCRITGASVRVSYGQKNSQYCYYRRT